MASSFWRTIVGSSFQWGPIEGGDGEEEGWECEEEEMYFVLVAWHVDRVLVFLEEGLFGSSMLGREEKVDIYCEDS